MTLPGINHLLAQPKEYLKGKTLGLIVNHTSLTSDHQHSIVHFNSHSYFILKALFAPEHGLYGIAQDMIAIENEVDPISGLNIVSLYGKTEETLEPNLAALEEVDNLVFDIQDVGARYYTFIYTMANCMQICKKSNTRMIVCDRPNPINGVSLEGNLVTENYRSFVGQYPLPNRHAMTVGELALFLNHEINIGCELKVVPMTHWYRKQWYDETRLNWVPPSPNIPTLDTATVYPGMCLIEGTQLSEGRGTTRPFESFGAPFIDPYKLSKRIQNDIAQLPGVIFRPQFFKPMFQKHKNEVCGGLQIYVTDRNQFKPLLTTVALLRAVAELYPKKFKWRTEPYEFVNDRLAIDLLYGNTHLRETILNDSFSLANIEESWQEELDGFKKLRNNYLIY
ncbi:MAG: DUF1343 domain-containing protein [Nitrospinota bacterium]|nr:DUF1343 domain-containing protein [Nitrospinota bacterium]